MTITHCVGYDQPTYISTEFRQRVVNDSVLFTTINNDLEQSSTVKTGGPELQWNVIIFIRHCLVGTIPQYLAANCVSGFRNGRDIIYTPPLVISSSYRLNSCGLWAFSVLGLRLWNPLWDLFWHKTTTPAAILSKRNILNLWWLFNGPKVWFNPKVWWSTRTSEPLIRTNINCMQCLNFGKIGSHIEHIPQPCIQPETVEPFA